MKRPVSLSQAIARYLAYRRALGFALSREGTTLKSLGSYARNAHHRGPLTKELAIQWAQAPANADRLWWARRLEMVRGFARFWVAFDPRTQIPPPGVFGPAYRRRNVHIYSTKEIQALLQAAQKQRGFHGLTLRTLLALLTCTGMRISEALALQDSDVQWKNHTIIIRKSKFRRSRCIPLHPSTLRALQAYQRSRHKRFHAAQKFFTNTRGGPLSYHVVSSSFVSLRQSLGWNQHPLPRIHDLRHTFAVNTLLGWYRQGQDVGSKLICLTTYLGHQAISSTYWYFSAVPALMAIVGKRLTASPRKGSHA